MRAAVAAVAMLLIAASCSEPPPATLPTPSRQPTEVTTEAQGGTFRWAISEPDAILPWRATTPGALAVVDALFDPLLTYDADLGLVAGAAESWLPVDGDPARWRIVLRAGSTFHDGSAVTAADVAFSWAQAVREGPHGWFLRDVVGHEQVRAGQADELAGVHVVGDRIIEVELSGPRADLPHVLTHPGLAPVPRAAYEADRDGFAEQPIGNGPFIMAEAWAHDEFIRASRWDGYRTVAEQARIAEVLFQISDIDTAFAAFRQGRRDLAALPPEALELARAEFGEGVTLVDSATTYLLAFNTTRRPYDDREVRRAISQLVDRQEIATQLQPGHLIVADSVLPAGLGGPATSPCDACTFNPVGAGRTLERLGVDQLSFAFNAGGGHEQVRDILREDLSTIGVALVSNRRGPAPSFPEYLEWLSTGRVGMFRDAVTAETLSYHDLLYPLLHSSQTPDAGGLNAMRYDSARIDALLEAARRLLDEEERRERYRRVERVALDDQVVVPVVGLRDAVVVADRVEGLRVDLFGRVNLTQIELRQ